MHRGAIRRSEGRRSPAAAVLIDSDSDDGDAVAVVARPATAAVPAAPRARTPPAPDEVDAVTAEKLHPTHWVVVVSPDGKLKTYYNTSTLIRIAQTKGRWMQPPHFREAMSDELRREILRIEDRDITVNIPLFRQAAHEAAGTWDEEVDVQGLEVAEHFVLDKRQLYVCPVCFVEARKPLIKEADDQLAEAKAAMEAAQGTPEAEDAQAAFACMASEHARLEWRRCPIEVLSRLDPQYQLPYVVFPNAAVFKAHVRNCHGDMDGDVSDHTLRSMVNAFLAEHNQKHFENRTFHRSHETTARYWFAHARFNTMRYNRLRSAIDQYQPADVRTKCVFETGVTYDDGQADVDFVDDDDADDDDDDGAVGFAAALMKDGGAAGNDEESDSDLSSAASLLGGDGLTVGHAGAGGDPRSEADVLRRLERRAKAERILKKHRREMESSSSSDDSGSSGSAESSNGTEASTSSDRDTEDNVDEDDGSASSTSSVHSSEVGAAAILSRPSQGGTAGAAVVARGPHAVNRMSAYERRKAADIDLYLRNRDADLVGGGEFSPAPRSSMTLVQSTLSEMFGRAPRSPAPPTVRPHSHRHDVVIHDDDDDDEGDDPTTRMREEMLKRVRAKEEAARAKSQGTRKPDHPPPPPPPPQPSVVAPRVPPPTAVAAQPPPRRSRVLIDDD